MEERASARLAAGGAVHRALEDVIARCDVPVRVANDPIEIVRRYRDRSDAEIVALVASSLAFGNVRTIRAKVNELLERVGPSPARAADDERALRGRLRGFRHRVYRGEDVAGMMIGARRLQRAHGSLGARFAADLRAASGELREALGRFVSALRSEGGLERSRSRGARHLLPDPRAGSGCKRLLLFLRWMVRGPDGVDLGLWRAHVPTAALLVPVDVHVHKLARNLGLTDRRAATFLTTEEITAALRRFDPEDPVRFDFALCHMGMVQQCPSRRDPRRCEGCPVQPVCRWWT